MIYLIVGHRGVGKTLWLKKLKKLFASFQKTGVQTPLFFDLDKKMEKTTQRSIHSYFQDQDSQKIFRQLEHTVLMDLIYAGCLKTHVSHLVLRKETTPDLLQKFPDQFGLNKYKLKKHVVFIALGAGFEWQTFDLFSSVSGTGAGSIEPSDTLCLSVCDLSVCDSALRIIHLMRETDSHGRVFLDRPRLCQNKSPYEEYMFFYPQREKVYRQVRTESFVLPEQDFEFSKAEELFFAQELFPDKNLAKTSNDSHNSNSKALSGAIITLNKKSLPARTDQWPAFIQKRLSWGLSFFELRDDQLQEKELEYLLTIIPKCKQLLSFYSKKNYFFNKIIETKRECDDVVQNPGAVRKVSGGTKERPSVAPAIWVDWPLEKDLTAFSPSSKVRIIASLHERKEGESIRGLGQKLIQHRANHFKLAVPVKSFSELLEGHLWFLQDPENRSFLPVSTQDIEPQQEWRKVLFLPQNRKWAWYRQVFGPYMKMNFIREGPSFVPDQAFLYEHLNSARLLQERKRQGFGLRSWQNQEVYIGPLFCAVLGDPVVHSASPAFHRKFFEKQDMVFVKIPMTEQEMTKENLSLLQKMGLRFSAVTSPLKQKAFAVCDVADSPALSLQSVNTLIWKQEKWVGYNTDLYGFKMFMQGLAQRLDRQKKVGPFASADIAVWGGGGVRALLQKVLPNAIFYSARTGKALFSPTQKKAHKEPETVIWAVGRSRMPSCLFPPISWKPQWVIDLNYSADSPGKEYALLCGAKYISGQNMFQYQALRQQQLFLNLNF